MKVSVKKKLRGLFQVISITLLLSDSRWILIETDVFSESIFFCRQFCPIVFSVFDFICLFLEFLWFSLFSFFFDQLFFYFPIHSPFHSFWNFLKILNLKKKIRIFFKRFFWVFFLDLLIFFKFLKISLKIFQEFLIFFWNFGKMKKKISQNNFIFISSFSHLLLIFLSSLSIFSNFYSHLSLIFSLQFFVIFL